MLRVKGIWELEPNVIVTVKTRRNIRSDISWGKEFEICCERKMCPDMFILSVVFICHGYWIQVL